MARLGRSWTALTLALAVLTAGGCAKTVTGHALQSSGQFPTTAKAAPIPARDLLLQDGQTTPLGRATAAPVSNNYFTSARPPGCSAAILFEGSPLRPAGSTDHAESSYKFDSQALATQAAI